MMPDFFYRLATAPRFGLSASAASPPPGPSGRCLASRPPILQGGQGLFVPLTSPCVGTLRRDANGTKVENTLHECIESISTARIAISSMLRRRAGTKPPISPAKSGELAIPSFASRASTRSTSRPRRSTLNDSRVAAPFLLAGFGSPHSALRTFVLRGSIGARLP